MGLFNNMKFPAWTMQQLNLDWLLDKVKTILGFIPENGEIGDLLVRTEDGASWESVDDVMGDTGWIDIANTSVHYRRKNGYVTVAFDGSTATSYRGTADWEVIATLPEGFRPDTYAFFHLGAGGHSSDYSGEGYINTTGNIGIYFDNPCTYIAGFVIYPV